jgi:hypothetical protein
MKQNGTRACVFTLKTSTTLESVEQYQTSGAIVLENRSCSEVECVIFHDFASVMP